VKEYEIKERVAAGLRRLKTPPDYLLLCDGDMKESQPIPCKICSIPVVYSAFVYAPSCYAITMLFCPVWTTPGYYTLERKAFEDGYEEWEKKSCLI
jgi:hypothetical protein